MKKILFFVALLGMVSCHNTKKNDATLNNTLNVVFADSTFNGQKAYIYAAQDLLSDFKAIDSTVVTHGKLSFVRQGVDTPSVHALVILGGKHGQKQLRILFVNEKGAVDIQVNNQTSVIKGGAFNTAYQNYMDKNASITKELMAITGASAEDDAKAQPLLTQQSHLLTSFIAPNMKNQVGELFFRLGFITLDDSDRMQLINLATPEFKQLMGKLMKPLSAQEIVGLHFLDLKGKTPEGETINLSDYAGKGKVVLVDFWASWCGPCREEMPNVVDAYAKYKNKGFEIVGISLDSEKSAWIKAIKDLHITWLQMSDLKGWDSNLAAAYNVRSIPFTLLIDKDGTIVAEDLRGSELDDKLRELLN